LGARDSSRHKGVTPALWWWADNDQRSSDRAGHGRNLVRTWGSGWSGTDPRISIRRSLLPRNRWVSGPVAHTAAGSNHHLGTV